MFFFTWTKEVNVTPSSFRKTLLAIAVTSTTLSAHAGLALNGSTADYKDGYIAHDYRDFSGTTTITGSFQSTEADRDGIEFEGVEFHGDLILDATVDVVDEAFELGAYHPDADALAAGEVYRRSSVNGGVINKGSLSVKGDAVVMMIEDTTITGDVINEGVLKAISGGNIRYIGTDVDGDGIDEYTSPVYDDAHGLDIISSTIGKELKNTGTIIADGTTAGGIRVQHSDLGDKLTNTSTGQITISGDMAGGIEIIRSQIPRGLENFGEISVSGEDAVGIYVHDSNIGGVLNDGKIHVNGEYATGVDFDMGSLLSELDNDGEIIATGEQSTAVLIDGVNFFAGYNDNRQIRNGGIIQGDKTAIEIEEFSIAGDQAGTLTIDNRGDILGGSEAIDAETAMGKVNLQWDGRNGSSTISGDLIDLSQINIVGNVVYNGTSDWTEDADIRMRDNGTVFVGNAGTVGQLALGQAHTDIEGNLSVATGSSLGMTLTTVTDPNKPVLFVTGSAEFGKGSQIKLASKGSDFSAEGSQYTLVEAGELIDNGLSVTSSSTLLNVDTFATEGNQVIATVTGKGASEIEDVITAPGNSSDKGTANAAQAAAAFAPALSVLPANDPIWQVLTGGTPAQQAQVIQQLAPEISGGATQAAVSGQSLISNVAAGRTGGARGMSSGDAFQQTGVWVQALHSDATQDLRDGVAGYDARTNGIAVGADGKLNDQLTLGLAYSFLNTDVDADSGNKTKVDGHAFTLYGGFTEGNIFVDGSLTYGLNDNEGKRRIAGTMAKADYDSTLLGVNTVVGYSYNLQGTVVVEPQLTARYSLVDIDSINESGSSAALNTDSQRYEVGEVGAGVRLAGNLPMGQGSLSPQIKLMAYHDLIADQAESTSSFVLGGTPFVTTGAKPERNSYEIGLAADYRLGALTLGVGYDYFGKSDYSSDTFTAKVRYDF